MRIRAFKKEDAIKVSRIIRKCLREINSKDYPRKVIGRMVNYFSPEKFITLSEKRKVFVAVEKETVLGTASVQGNVILTVFVNPALHGKGIGTRLMAQAENEVRKHGFASARVPSSITSVDFYKRLGYTKVKEKYEEDAGKIIIMRKQLWPCLSG